VSADDFYVPNEKTVIKPLSGVVTERAFRLYSNAPGSWLLQVRAPETLKDGREGRSFYVAGSSLSRLHLIALRQYIDEQLAKPTA